VLALLGSAATQVVASYADYYAQYAQTCDVHVYCQWSVSFYSFCRTWESRPTCAWSRIPCGNVCAPRTTETTRAPSTTQTSPVTTLAPTTTQTTSTPVTLPAILATNQEGLKPPGCARTYGAPISDFFLWTEWPSISDVGEAEKYYAGLLGFVRANCAGLGVTRIILRVLHPHFPWKDQSFYLPSVNAVLYRAFISKLPENVELVMYGYVMEAPAISAWTSEMGTATAVEGVVAFMKRWNDFLASLGSRQSFRGVVYDLEEFPSMQKISPWTLNAANVAALKSKYGQFEFSTTIGFDAVGAMNTQAPFVDKMYLQIYDLYHPYAYVGATQDSRFLTYKNDPNTMGDFILNTVLGANIMNAYTQYSQKIMLMWSNQNLVGTCLYPLDGKMNCGANYEFGVWEPDAYNAFVNYVKNKSPSLRNLKHGLFQYSFTPPSWVCK
jgi:hypothetical protein